MNLLGLHAANLALALLLGSAVTLSVAGPATAASQCSGSQIGKPVRLAAATLGPGPSRLAITVTDLSGGSPQSVLLKGLLLPEAARASDRTALLDALKAEQGRALLLVEADRKTDRHGRRTGHLRLPAGGSLTVTLLERGLALLDGRTPPCAAEAAAERRARLDGRGLWSGPMVETAADAPNTSSSPAFVVVAGRVLSIGKAGRTTYLNFGRNFAMDTTVRIGEDIVNALRADGTEPHGLSGRLVLVRGFATPTDGLDLPLTSSGALELME